MEITSITRRDIFDLFRLESIFWNGRLDESDFLDRLYDLSKMPSYDSRYPNAYGDIYQHRINNYDWGDDWVFTDDRFDLKNGSDEIFLKFLAETIHPAVRSDKDEIVRIANLYNAILVNDNYQLVEVSQISGRPLYKGQKTGHLTLPSLQKSKRGHKP